VNKLLVIVCNTSNERSWYQDMRSCGLVRTKNLKRALVTYQIVLGRKLRAAQIADLSPHHRRPGKPRCYVVIFKSKVSWHPALTRSHEHSLSCNIALHPIVRGHRRINFGPNASTSTGGQVTILDNWRSSWIGEAAGDRHIHSRSDMDRNHVRKGDRICILILLDRA